MVQGLERFLDTLSLLRGEVLAALHDVELAVLYSVREAHAEELGESLRFEHCNDEEQRGDPKPRRYGQDEFGDETGGEGADVFHLLPHAQNDAGQQ